VTGSRPRRGTAHVTITVLQPKYLRRRPALDTGYFHGGQPHGLDRLVRINAEELPPRIDAKLREAVVGASLNLVPPGRRETESDREGLGNPCRVQGSRPILGQP
jgi:hypothetical protein